MKEEALKLADDLDAMKLFGASGMIRRLVEELDKQEQAWQNFANIEFNEVNKDFKICELPKIKPQQILKRVNKKITIGFDPKLFTSNSLKNIITNNLINLRPVKNNLIDKIWKNKSKVKNNKFYLLEEKYHGENYLYKINKVKEILKSKNIHYLICTAVENISWLLNIRGSDSMSSPLTYGKILFNKKICTKCFYNIYLIINI